MKITACPGTQKDREICIKLEDFGSSVQVILYEDGKRIPAGHVGTFHVNSNGKLYFARATFVDSSVVDTDDAKKIRAI